MSSTVYTKLDELTLVCPASEQIYLPLSLQLIVLDESGATIPTLEARATSVDKWIQLEISGRLRERFSVKVALGDVSITEDFVI
ncbi:MAG: DUF1822 family protein [Coleofasciculus sp. S288]|nr:DUF1822 family protein [Coleofasciculus sp. S288]